MDVEGEYFKSSYTFSLLLVIAWLQRNHGMNVTCGMIKLRVYKFKLFSVTWSFKYISCNDDVPSSKIK